MKRILLFISAVLVTFFSTGQTLTQTRICTRVGTNSPERWTSSNADNVAADDNKYLSTVKLLSGTSRPTVFSGFNFSIPENAVIEKIGIEIRRLKSGKNNVKDAFCSLVTGPTLETAFGNFPNVASPEYWTTSEKTISYTEPPSGVGTDGNPFRWTAAMVNAAYFGVFYDIGFFSGGSGAVASIEKLAVTVYYTLPSTTTAAAKNLPENEIRLSANNNSVFINALLNGRYLLTVTDRFGTVLQKQFVTNPTKERLLLNAKAKGYIIISVEGMGIKKSLQTFVE